MKNLIILPTIEEYRAFILEKIVAQRTIQEHPFYHNLIEFIVDHRSPIFFEPSDECEYAHFTQSFAFILMRKGYENRTIEDLYYLHDFVHMLFGYPLQPRSFTIDWFRTVALYNEYIASNETEIMTYYRLPELRKKTFEFPILFDFLFEKSDAKPTVKELFETRKNYIDYGKLPAFIKTEEAKEVLSFLSRFKDNNEAWVKLWYYKFPAIEPDLFSERLTLPIRNYDSLIYSYVPVNSQKLYEDNILHNIRYGLSLLGETGLPSSFAECQTAVKKLENRIIMEDIAREFHQKYVEKKYTKE